MKRGEWTKLGKEKLLSSGLTSKQGEELGMYEVVSAAQLDKSLDARPALVIPYFGLDKKPLAARPHWPHFFRVRYLTNPVGGFKEATGEKPQRYAQPPASGVCAYFPKSTDWAAIAADPEFDIIITEGELKAAAACGAGFPTIGLGGVWNFRSSKEGVWLLPELAGIKWPKRTTYICFDSDYLNKPGVCLAINGLLDELEHHGANVHLLALPEGEKGAKQGLDDFLLAHGAERLRELIGEAQPLGLSRTLWNMNEEVVYIENPGFIMSLDDNQRLTPEAFKAHSRWATASTAERRVGAQGRISYEKVPAAPEWIRWPLRRSVKRVTYAPGESLFTECNSFNQWRGWGTEPVKGSVEPWLKLTQFIFSSTEKGILDWFYDWCAYPVQNPGVKMFTAVVIHGTAQGTGKTLVGYTLGRVYGDNFKEITDEDLEESYWAENKQFILGDEITGKDNRQYMNTLKRLITKETIDINIKFIPQFQLPNRMNFMFTSQHGDSFFLEDKDRRFMVIEVTEDPLPEAFYINYDRWYKREGGDAALHDWLLRRKISPSFNPMAPAPRTMAKERMIAATKSEAGSWLHDLKHYPEQILFFGQHKFTRDLFSSKELLQMYERDHPNSKVTPVGLGRMLGSGGFQQVMGGQVIFNPNTGKNERLFIVRNPHIWRDCKDRAKIDKHLKTPTVRMSK